MSTRPSLLNHLQMQHNATRRYSEKNGFTPLGRKHLRDHELSQKQRNSIPLLLQGLSDAQVGQQVGVDRVTIFRWRQEERFDAELQRQRGLLWRQSVGRLQSLIEPALDILQKQIAGEDPKTALRAASILLRIASPARLARMSQPERPDDSDDSNAESFEKALEAYINAPLPGELTKPSDQEDEEEPDDE